MPAPLLRVIGARSHNLRGIDVDLPHGRWTGICGPSGSGKSSLVHETILREARRAYERAFFLSRASAPGAEETLAPAPVDAIEGLRPALGLEARRVPRGWATVASLGELHEGWRALLGHRGVPYCPNCAVAVSSRSAVEVRDELLERTAGRRTVLLAPADTRELDGAECRALLERWVADGFLRARIDGRLESLDPPPAFDASPPATLEVVVDRLIPRPEQAARLLEAVERGLELGAGRLIALVEEEGELTLTTARRCPGCGVRLEPLTPASFRLRRRSACPACEGETRPTCERCAGTGWSPQALATRWNGRTALELATCELHELAAHVRRVPADHADRRAFGRVLDDLERRIGAFEDLGLSYLSCARRASTLSGGELMRVRIAQLLGARLADALYVLDEPTVGLHPQDTRRVVRALRALVDQGNTVLVVEHDVDVLRACDHLIEMGPGAGPEGGRVVFAGPPEALAARDDSPTGRYLGARSPAPERAARTGRSGAERPRVAIRGARGHNLRDVSLHVPLGVLTGFAGVSGSGKSSLVLQTLVPALRASLGVRGGEAALPFDAVEPGEGLVDVVALDQTPFAAGARSNLATFTRIWNDVRELFAATPEARMRGYSRARFSMNVARSRGGGRCETCRGAGLGVVDLAGLPRLTAPCAACAGRRFSEDTLAVRFSGRDVAAVLDGSVAEARALFAFHPRIARTLQALLDLGLGYLPLGSPAGTLSGGEAQRVQIAVELARAAHGHTLYVLDEPTRGLHPRDVDGLLTALHGLVDLGHSVWIVEHDPRVLAACDHLIELGPGAGREGGTVVWHGAPGERPERPAPAEPREHASAAAAVPAAIRFEGVRTKNLALDEVDLERGALTVFAGPAGAGKSAFVIDTVHREARRRFAEILGPNVTRTLAGSVAAPVDRIRGLGPTLAVTHEGATDAYRSGRSLAEILDLLRPLRALFALRAQPHCSRCVDEPLVRFDARGVALHARRTWPGERVWVLAPFYEPEGAAEDGRGFLERRREALVSQGWIRVFGAGREWRIDGPRLPEAFPTDRSFHVVIDRVVLDETCATGRLDEALETAFTLGRSTLHLVRRESPDELATFSRDARCVACGTTWSATLEPADFSPATVRGACATCRGRGREEGDAPCGSCAGERIGAIGRSARLCGMRLAEVLGGSLADLERRLPAWRAALGESAVEPAVRQATDRLLDRLQEHGGPARTVFDLGHLTLERTLGTLSTSETAGVQVLVGCGTGLHAATFAWDDPTHGFDGAGRERVAAWLRRLLDGGHTACAASNDPALLAHATAAFELGPGDGAKSTRRAFRDLPAETPLDVVGRAASSATVTCRWNATPVRSSGAFDLPFGAVTRVVGAAHAGKSRTLREDLLPALRAALGAGRVHLVADPPASAASVAEACGVDEAIATLWARIPEAVRAGYDARAFRLGAGRRPGACPGCAGRGSERVALDFLGDLEVPCETCGGARFTADVRAIRDRGRSIDEVHALTVREAAEHFAEHPAVREPLRSLERWHLGHLVLGRPTSALSSTERRVLHLHAAARAAGSEPNAFLVDLPLQTSHPRDRGRTAARLVELARAGHAVVLVDDLDRPLVRGADAIAVAVEADGRRTATWRAGRRSADPSAARVVALTPRGT